MVVASNGDELLIHAKKARSKCVDLLTWRGVAVLFMGVLLAMSGVEHGDQELVWRTS